MYPYWKDEFDKEFDSKHYQVWYRERGWHKSTSDVADAYRVFMILCNEYGKSRMEVLKMLKEATEENPIEYHGETFWTESMD